MKDFEKADWYSQIGNDIGDSIQSAGQKNITKFHNAILEENLRNNEKELTQISIQNRRRSYAFITGLLLFSVIGLLLYRNNRQKQKANKVLEKTLGDLKSTQCPTDPIGKNGLSWRAYRRHCPRNPEPAELCQ
ncbi:MAG: hypothetical protein U5K79_01610 [Cyclobacteriaceae bacterium]|nr:hypothetical protein [Cyclobacteriaceae bacterium]